MQELAGVQLSFAALLVVAGVVKVVDPLPLVRALRSLGLPGGRRVVRMAAGAEVAIGVWVAATGSPAAATALALSYVVFTGVVVLGLRRGGVLSSCGCFGRADTPPTRLHAVLTACGAAVGTVGAVRPVGDLLSLLRAQPGHGGPLLVTVAALASATYLAMAVLPLLGGHRRGVA